jgi:hypothetical protein
MLRLGDPSTLLPDWADENRSAHIIRHLSSLRKLKWSQKKTIFWGNAKIEKLRYNNLDIVRKSIVPDLDHDYSSLLHNEYKTLLSLGRHPHLPYVFGLPIEEIEGVNRTSLLYYPYAPSPYPHKDSFTLLVVIEQLTSAIESMMKEPGKVSKATIVTRLQKEYALEYKLVRQWIPCAARTIAFAHRGSPGNRGIRHGDIKAENSVYCDGWIFIDWCDSEEITDETAFDRDDFGYTDGCAPWEIVVTADNGNRGLKSDMFSLARVLGLCLAVLCGTLPTELYAAREKDGINKKVEMKDWTWPNEKAFLDSLQDDPELRALPDLRRLLDTVVPMTKEMLNKDIDSRPSAAEFAAHMDYLNESEVDCEGCRLGDRGLASAHEETIMERMLADASQSDEQAPHMDMSSEPFEQVPQMGTSSINLALVVQENASITSCTTLVQSLPAIASEEQPLQSVPTVSNNPGRKFTSRHFFRNLKDISKRIFNR